MSWFPRVGLAVALAVLGSTPVLAQFVGSGTGPSSINSQVQKNLRGAALNGGPKPDIQPPVLPGTKAPTEAAEPTQSAAQMTPTEALFDAINRGDLPTARDAINRGAELDGKNLLGMTPLELSVDLGRNDISFVLLSMRGDDPSVRRDARRDTDQAGVEPRRTVSRARVMAASARVPDEPVSVQPRFNSGNGGTPIPAAGFLGFDERSAR